MFEVMETRINLFEKGAGAIKAMQSVGIYLAKSPVEQHLLHLVEYRVSQINGCAFCLDMHSKDLRAEGETEQRIYTISAWRETPFFTPRERAALAWTEALVNIENGQVPDEVYEDARAEFSEQELIDLTLAITTTSAYNRFNIAFRPEVGTYKPGIFKVRA